MEVIIPARIPHVWDEFGPELARALKRDASRDLMAVYRELLAGRLVAWRVNGGWVVTEFTLDEAGNRSLWVVYAAGVIATGLRGFVSGIMGEFERMARTGVFGPLRGRKCKQIRIWGRKGWQRLLPDYDPTPMADGRVEYRKVL